MKTWILNQLSKKEWCIKKPTARIALVTLIVNILAPGLTYAALPSFGNNLVQPNVLAVAQMNELTLPRDLVVGDQLNLTVSGTTLAQTFSGSSLITAQLFNAQIDSLAETFSVYDDITKKFTITSENPGIPFTLSNLIITRSSISPTTPVGNAVAVAQQSEISIPQALFTGDVINFSVDGIAITQNFSTNKDATLQTFANQITTLTSVSGSYDNVALKVTMTAKTPGVAFDMSNLVITSNGIVPSNIQSNVVPVAQVDTINFTRPIYSDETITLTLSGTVINQPFNTDYNTTLSSLALQIDALPNVDSTYTGGILTITSSVPGVSFGTGSINIHGGTVNAIVVTPNQIAVAQEDTIVVPRDLYIGDTINLNIGGTILTQGFSATTSATIGNLITQIDALPNVFVSNYIPGLRAITIKSNTPGTAFGHPTLYLSSAFNTTPSIANQVAQTQITDYIFPRALVLGDNVSAIINGNPISVNYLTGSTETINNFANTIQVSLSGTLTAIGGSGKVTLTAINAGTPFTTQSLQIVNTLAPIVLVANIVPTKQREIITFPQTLVAGDTISVTINSSVIAQSFVTNGSNTLSLLNSQIDALSEVTSTLDDPTKTITIDSAIAGTSFTISDVTSTSSNFTSSNVTPNVPGNNAELSIGINGTVIPFENITVGNCNITFAFSGGAWDLDCVDNSATVDTISINKFDMASMMGAIKNITDTTSSGTRNLNATVSGSNIIYKTTGLEISNSPINLDLSGSTNIILNYNSGAVAAVAQVDNLTLPRGLVQGDTFTTTINGITVTQNFLSNSGVTFSNLVTQIDNLPNINATGSNNIITITSSVAGTPFTGGISSITNTQTPTLTISNITAVAQKNEVNFPASFVSGDVINITIDGTAVSQSFNGNSNTTIGDLATQITSATTVNATLSGSLGLILEAKNAGTAFTIDKLEIKNTTPVTPVSVNIPGTAQVDILNIPFVPVTGDIIGVTVNGSTVTQSFINDIFTTYSVLNSQIDNLASVNSTYDSASGTFTITSAVAGTPFIAGFSSTGVTINSTVVQPNVDSGAQVDNLVVSRQITSGDTMTLNIAGYVLTQNFNTNKLNTLQALNTQIDALAEVTSAYDNVDTFTITSATPGISFTSGVLTINTTYSSVNQTANVPAQAQIDQITLPRTLIIGDKLNINIEGIAVSNTFTGSQATTLNNFITNINSVQSGSIASISGGNNIVFTANQAGIPFTIGIGSFIIDNTSFANTNVNNVTAVAQQTDFTIPTFVTGDTVSFTVNASTIIQNFVTDSANTINQIITQINSSEPNVTSSYLSGSGIIHTVSNIAGTPFTISNISIVNTTSPTQTVANVVPVAQIVRLYPSGILREGITFRTTVEGTNYDYLTTPTDGIPEIITGVNSSIANTGVINSTGTDITGDYVQLTAVIPGVAFTYNSNAIDITPPTISTPINLAEQLRSGAISTSTVEINEDGDIYMVLNGTTINTALDITNAIANNQAFAAKMSALSHIAYTVQIPAGVVDGLYNIVATDPYNNISGSFAGWLTVDNTPPTVNITTLSQTVNTDTITINGITEPNRPVIIAGGVGTVNITADGAGVFSWNITLNQNVSNTITVTATDAAGNVGSGSVVIIHDNIITQNLIINALSYTNSGSANINIQTDTGILAEVYSGIAVIASGMTDGSGNITLGVTLNINSANNFHIVVTDSGSNANSGNIVIIQDSIVPNVIANPLPTLIHANYVNVTGITESNSNISINNNSGTFIVNGTSSSTGVFSISVPLVPDSNNDMFITAVDLAGNTGTGNVTTYENSIPNTLLINTPSQFTQSSVFTITGSTAPSSTLIVTGGVGTITGTLDLAGNFSATVVLNQNSVNMLLITSTDQLGNVSTGSLTITHDTIAPGVNITTPLTPTNNLIINITGTTEANSTLVITGGNGTFNGISDNLGDFNIPVSLNSGIANLIVATATDQAGNVGSNAISITHDPVVVFITIGVPAVSYTNQNTFSFTGTTKPNLNVDVVGGSGVLNLVSDISGNFSGTIVLNQNIQNNIVITVTDVTLTTATTGFIVNHDNIVPTLTFDPYPSATAQSNILLTGIAEPNAIVAIGNGTTNITANTSSTGSFNITFPLNLNVTNNLIAAAQDLAGNTSTGVNLTITHDNIGPVISSIVITQVLAGPVMNADYSFLTNENATSTFYIGTGSNVNATLLTSNTTVGLTSTGTIPGLTPNVTYYYYIQSIDSLGNISQTPVATINSIDSAGPVIISQNISNITVSGAQLDFNYQDANFNTGTLATGSINITDGTTTQTLNPTLGYGIGLLNGNIAISTLNTATTYNYTISLTDDFGNQSTSSGSFLTASNVVLTGTTITQTGTITIPIGTGNTIDMSGTTLILISDPITSGISSGSLTIPGNSTIIFGTGWNGSITPPMLIDPNSTQAATNTEIAGLVSSLNTSTTTYSGTVQQTIFAGGNTTLSITGGLFGITTSFQNNLVGQTLHIYISQDGNTWGNNNPTTVCTVSASNICTFQGDTLGYFTFASVTGTSIVVPPVTPPNTGGGGGGGSLSMDYCPNGDYSVSYYDGTCGTKPSGTGSLIDSTNDSTNNSGVTVVVTNNNIDQIVSKYILKIKQDNYSVATTQEQKINVWEKVIQDMKNRLKDISISDIKKDLFNRIKDRAKEIMDTLIFDSQEGDKVIDGSGIDTQYKPSVEVHTNENNGISIYKFIDVDHMVVIRDFGSYKGNILAYLPRNYRVEVVEYGDLWSKIIYEGEKTGYIRTKFLRDENRQDRGRTASIMVFFDTNLQTDVDMRKVKVAKSLWVRRGPGISYGIKGLLFKNQPILILDTKRINGWYEIRWTGGTGWVNGKYVEEMK